MRNLKNSTNELIYKTEIDSQTQKINPWLPEEWGQREGQIGSMELTDISENRSVMSDSLRPHGLYSPWNSPGQNTGVGSLSLLQGIFPTQGSNPGLPHCGQILYQLSLKESLRILEWIAYSFTRGPSWPRNWTWISRIAGGFFANWASREALTDINHYT